MTLTLGALRGRSIAALGVIADAQGPLPARTGEGLRLSSSLAGWPRVLFYPDDVGGGISYFSNADPRVIPDFQRVAPHRVRHRAKPRLPGGTGRRAQAAQATHATGAENALL
jgi:hypothetical protein